MLQLLMIFAAVFIATLPMVAFLLVVWWLDRYEREPLWMVGATFSWGAVGAVLLAILFSLILDTSLGMVLDASAQDTAGAVIIAPLVEELTKGCILLLLLRHRLFDNATDGFVYGAAAGLGFGMTENFMYFSMIAWSGDVVSFAGTAFARTLFSAPLHAMASGMFGASLGLAKYLRFWPARVGLPFVGIAAGMLLHFAWNASAVAASMGHLPFWVGFVGLAAVFVVLFTLYQVSMLHEKHVIRTQLADEARHGLLPPSYVPILSSWLRRQRRGWLPPSIPHHHFIALCTRLAFRKHQAERVPESKRYDYLEEVRVLRQELQALVEKGAGG
jgi:protease PrsW